MFDRSSKLKQRSMPIAVACVLQTVPAMNITDVLELLTQQHEEILRLVSSVREAPDVATRWPLLDELGTKLATHLGIEQELLYPELTGVVSVDVQREMMAEHVEIKRVLADLLWLEPEGEHFEQRLETFGQLLVGHVQWQEAELFVTVANAVSPVRITDLVETMRAWSNPPAFAIQAA